MYPLHDKDLDRLSRDAAGRYEMDFGPSGWEQLEKRLDQELPQKKDRRRFLFWLFFIVVTTGGALIGLLFNSQPVTPLASSSIQSAPVKQDVVNNTPTTPSTSGARQPATIINQDAANNNQTTVHNTPTTPLTNGADQMRRHIKAQPSRGNNNAPATPGQHAANTPSKKITAAPFGLNNIPRRYHNQAINPVAKNRRPLNNDKNDQPDNDRITTADNKDITQPTNDAVATVTDPQKTTTVPTPDKTTTATDSTKTPGRLTKDAAPKKKNNTPNRGFELGIVAGPDASMIEFGPLYKAGYNAGLQIGYRFSDRWSVNTGIIYTRKFYQADSNTFHAPKHSYISYVKLDRLEGYCAMLDIPLNVRFDFAHNDKRRFFTNTGLSTYLMDKQNYDYYYWQTWGPAIYRDSSWASGKNEDYLFSVLNLGIGYERMLGKNMSLQVEPYLKIPLKGMGFGNMKMDSYGMYFSLKYRPQFGFKRQPGKK